MTYIGTINFENIEKQYSIFIQVNPYNNQINYFAIALDFPIEVSQNVEILSKISILNSKITHEIKNPLAAIQTLVSEIKTFIDNIGINEVINKLDAIFDYSEYMKYITKDFEFLALKLNNLRDQGNITEVDIKKVNFSSTNEISAFFNDADKEFSLLILENIVLKEDILNKILSKNANFAFLYSEYYDNVNNSIPLCDYTEGSVRDDFDFGKCLIVNNRLAKVAVKTLDKEISLAGFYDFRLQMSVLGKIIKTENFYTLYNIEHKDFETAHFAYCEPRNQNYQKEAEKVFTKFLKQINAYIQPVNSEVNQVRHQETHCCIQDHGWPNLQRKHTAGKP